LSVVFISEERGKIEIGDNPKNLVVCDPLDGSNNFKRGKGIHLPYCTLITVFDSLKPRMKNVLVAGIVEHIHGDIWYAGKGMGCFFNDKKCRTSQKKTIDRETLLIVDHYMSKDDVSVFSQIYKRGNVKDFGSASFHFAGVSCGQFDGYLSVRQKLPELSTGLLLIKEAGGFVTDLEGNELDDLRFSFNKKTPLIATATQQLNENIRKLLRR